VDSGTREHRRFESWSFKCRTFGARSDLIPYPGFTAGVFTFGPSDLRARPLPEQPDPKRSNAGFPVKATPTGRKSQVPFRLGY
jgi:hypothetical protein